MTAIKCFFMEFVRRTEDGNRKIFRRSDTGDELMLSDAPAGAMWHAVWLYKDPYWRGPDDHILIVRTPGGDWNIDSRCSNCGLPDDSKHRCWVRHGEAPNITVDKSGLTCNAGAGSIQCGSYHGFLERGYLVQNREDAPK